MEDEASFRAAGITKPPGTAILRRPKEPARNAQSAATTAYDPKRSVQAVTEGSDAALPIWISAPIAGSKSTKQIGGTFTRDNHFSCNELNPTARPLASPTVAGLGSSTPRQPSSIARGSKVWYSVLGLCGTDRRFVRELRGLVKGRLPALPGCCDSSSSHRSYAIGNGFDSAMRPCRRWSAS